MNILVDLSSTQPQGEMKKNGGGEYAYAVFVQLVKHDNVRIFALFNHNWGNNQEIIELCKKNNIVTRYYNNISDISTILRTDGIDKFFIPVCYSAYSDLIINDSIQLITVIHDLCELYYKRPLVKYGKYINCNCISTIKELRDKLTCRSHEKRVIEKHNRLIHISKNQTIVTVSNYTKSAMIYYLDTKDVSDIKVLYTPEKVIKFEKNDDRIFEDKELREKKYFMMTAGCRWAKNNTIVLFVLDSMFSNNKYNSFLESFKVVVLGMNKRYIDFYKKKLININRFVFKDYVSDSEMNALYSGAYMFFFPSVLEGFGMPPLEALKHNAIVACSTAMSIPEVCGSGVIYFDPKDEESIELSIIRAFDNKFVEEMLANGKEHLEAISQKRNADLETLVDMICD